MNLIADEARKKFERSKKTRDMICGLSVMDIFYKVQTEIYRAASRKHSVMVMLPELYSATGHGSRLESVAEWGQECGIMTKVAQLLEKDGFKATGRFTDGEIPYIIVSWREVQPKGKERIPNVSRKSNYIQY